MAGTSTTPTDWKTRLKIELQRDKKRTAILAIMLIVGGVVGGRAIVGARPKKVAAAPATNTQLAAAGCEQSNTVLGPAALAGRRRGNANTRREAYLSGLDRVIVRDLFRPNQELYPAAGAVSYGQVRNSGKQDELGGWFQQAERWVARSKRTQRDREAHAKVIKAQASALTLQSTMLGRTPSVLINGKVLQVGMWINGFQVRRISADVCVMWRDGVEVPLRLRGNGKESPEDAKKGPHGKDDQLRRY